MMKYVIPTIKTERFFSENIITGSKLNQEYIKEVDTQIEGLKSQPYNVSSDSVDNLLRYQ